MLNLPIFVSSKTGYNSVAVIKVTLKCAVCFPFFKRSNFLKLLVFVLKGFSSVGDRHQLVKACSHQRHIPKRKRKHKAVHTSDASNANDADEDGFGPVSASIIWGARANAVNAKCAARKTKKLLSPSTSDYFHNCFYCSCVSVYACVCVASVIHAFTVNGSDVTIVITSF